MTEDHTYRLIITAYFTGSTEVLYINSGFGDFFVDKDIVVDGLSVEEILMDIAHSLESDELNFDADYGNIDSVTELISIWLSNNTNKRVRFKLICTHNRFNDGDSDLQFIVERVHDALSIASSVLFLRGDAEALEGLPQALRVEIRRTPA